ncbi:hypothetical protein RD792_006059, partial [Penstemon davidsonii]
KKAREKEKRLLDQEKQVYQARIRFQIRANLESDENPEKPDLNQPNYSPLSPEDHIKALADRFMKEGAEDLWNEADGPFEIPATKPNKSQFTGKPIDLEKFVTEKRGSVGGGNLTNCRHFSTYTLFCGDKIVDYGNGNLRTMFNGYNSVGSCRSGILMDVRNVLSSRRYYSAGAVSSTSRRNFVRNEKKLVIGNGSDSKLKSGGGRGPKGLKFRGGKMYSSNDDDSDDYDDDVEEEKSESNVAIRKYVRIIKKRVPLKILEDEVDLSPQIEEIRKEVNMRKNMQEKERENAEEESIMSTKRFDECDVSSFTIRALTEAGYLQMTMVQEATLSACLEGKDALVKARAGTGKSVAFLLPAIETVLKASSDGKVKRVPPIYVLILCPTRELASQISAEANSLLKHHNGIGVQTLIGGTRFKVDERRLETDPCQIVVATPGRLLDHIENKSGISKRLMGLQMLVLDEADHLLDLGFRKDMEKIIDCLPRKRQSLLFSATIPKEVRRISQLVLEREYAYIDTLGIGCLETHAKVKQFYLVVPHDQHFEIVHHLLKSHISHVLEYKVIVFCATSMMTSLMCSLFREMKLNVREIHSEKPPLYRTRISNEFKESKGLILITSDASAQGMNYPDVSLVIQVGIPSDRGQYIHRLERTGCQGKEGERVLVLAPWEQYFVDEIKDLHIEKCSLPDLDPNVKLKIQESMEKVDTSVKEAAYHSWLGYYNSINGIGRDKTSLVEFANKFSESIGLEKPPALFRKTAIKMGLKNIPGIRVRK